MGVFGSLFYSNIMELPPCDLCWYQRIFLYPQLPLAIVAFYYQKIRKGKENGKKILPIEYLLILTVIGLLYAGYHLILQHFLADSGISTCSASAPCTEISVAYFGFITIPLMSFFAFLALLIIQIMVLLKNRK